ncbi:MAG: hypothetical protein CMJ64_09880 [Planctomycetaceae bacterium]|nr:hypothetical protein [Planctomycetaceae bacterium]
MPSRWTNSYRRGLGKSSHVRRPGSLRNSSLPQDRSRLDAAKSRRQIEVLHSALVAVRDMPDCNCATAAVDMRKIAREAIGEFELLQGGDA